MWQNANHTAILLKKHDIVPLILSHLHNVLSKLSASGCHNVDLSIKHQVMSCLPPKYNVKAAPSLMASLPPSRFQPLATPFYNTAVDYFGPMLVKERRLTVKRYGCLFTCLVTKALHIELAHSLDMGSYIMALQRMMGFFLN